MTKPVLGFICCSRILNNNRPAQSVTEQYLMGVAPHIDAIPLLIPAMPNLVDIKEIAKRIDGLLLTAVSYTHLDVYKRQLMPIGIARIKKCRALRPHKLIMQSSNH